MLLNNFTRRNALIRNIALGVGALAWVGISAIALLQGGGSKPTAREKSASLASTPTEPIASPDGNRCASPREIHDARIGR
jgi:hypothetical protein